MSVTQEEIDRVWKEADCLCSKEQVQRAIEAVAQQVESRLEKANPIVLAVMKGGLVFSSELMMRLNFPLELDYIHVTRYGFGLTGNELQWNVTPHESMEGRSVLIVDDILDEGQTLVSIISACKAQGAKEVLSAVLVDKKHDRKADPSFKADFTGLSIEDRFVFGYGMDYKGYLRNAAGIYAVKAE